MPIDRNFTFDPASGPLDPAPAEDRVFDVLMNPPSAEMGGLDDPAEMSDMEEEMEAPIPPGTFTDNLAELMDEEALQELGHDIKGLVEADNATMDDWLDIYAEGMKLLGFSIDNIEDEVFEGSCTVSHPLLAESIIKYQAKARSQILRPDGIARAKIVGKSTPEKKAQAERVAAYLNYQVMEQMPEYGPEHDRMLFHQAFGGSAFTKMYFDSALQRPVSRFVKPTNFIISAEATDLESAYRYTERIPIMANQFVRGQLDGLYLREVDLDSTDVGTKNPVKDEEDRISGRTPSQSGDDIYTLYEVHTYYCFDGQSFDDRIPDERDAGLELPYIITIDANSGKVVAIRRNWKEGDARYKKRLWYTHWSFIPGFGFHGYGYIHLIGGLVKSSTSSLRQLIDAGSFANLPGGFKAHGLRVVGSNEPLAPGEWRDIQAPGMDLDKALRPLPYKEPSQTLMSLLQFLVGAGQKFADSTEQVVAESTNYGPVGTTLALLEASGRLFTGIHERLFESQKRELAILADINSETLGQAYPYEVAGQAPQVAASDFDGRLDVIPVTDPREPTAAHRVARANATLSVAAQFPDLHNMPVVLQDLHTALGAEDAAKYLKQPNQAMTGEPVFENQLLLNNAAVKTAPYQDHMSHVAVHMALLQNDLYSQNPTVVAAIMAHVQSHLAENFRSEIQRAGVQLPQPGQQLPPELENKVALAAAQAVAQLKKAVLEKQDPELELKKAELLRKTGETRNRILADKRRERLEAAKLAQKDRVDRARLAQQAKADTRRAAVDLAVAKIQARGFENRRQGQ